jgi:dimethylaniline monooxygenase (N-oxide forming)
VEQDAERDEVSLRIAAPAAQLYDLVSDVTQMGRWSPECTGARWLGDAAGPAVGARFRGANRRGWVRWWTTNEVVTAEPGRQFAFETKQSGTRWGYRLEPDGEGATIVTEWREPFRRRPRPAAAFAGLLLGGVGSHDDEMRDGMRETLERLKAGAEAPS